MAGESGTTARGYGTAHQRLRAALAPEVATGAVRCWRCEQLIAAGATWQLGHDDDDRTIYRGPEHRRCNLEAAAAKTNGRRTVDRLGNRSREW